MVIVWLLVLLGAPVVAHAHDPVRAETPTLTASETAVVPHAPDVAFAIFGVETAVTLLIDAQRWNSSLMKRVIERLQDL